MNSPNYETIATKVHALLLKIATAKATENKRVYLIVPVKTDSRGIIFLSGTVYWENMAICGKDKDGDFYIHPESGLSSKEVLRLLYRISLSI